MRATPWIMLLAACLMMVSGAEPAQAQNMRVYTTVSDLSREGAPRVMSHNLTLFHAGKVYDYMEEAGEVVIFEPIHHRFIVLGKNYTATEVSFTQINHSLDATRAESQQVIEKLSQQPDDKSRLLGQWMKFQLDPAFDCRHDPQAQRFEFRSDPLSYVVQTARLDSPQFVQQYLDYIDWAARLNFVIHPNGNFPDVRIKMNEALRREDLLPTQVDLQKRMIDLTGKEVSPAGKLLSYRAEHQFGWEFQQVDRRHISHWERQLHSNDVRWVTFEEYQQQLVSQRTR